MTLVKCPTMSINYFRMRKGIFGVTLGALVLFYFSKEKKKLRMYLGKEVKDEKQILVAESYYST